MRTFTVTVPEQPESKIPTVADMQRGDIVQIADYEDWWRLEPTNNPRLVSLSDGGIRNYGRDYTASCDKVTRVLQPGESLTIGVDE